MTTKVTILNQGIWPILKNTTFPQTVDADNVSNGFAFVNGAQVKSLLSGYDDTVDGAIQDTDLFPFSVGNQCTVVTED